MLKKQSPPNRIVIPAHTRSVPAPRKPAAVIAIGVGPAPAPLPSKPSAPPTAVPTPAAAPNPLAGLLRSSGGSMKKR